MEVPIVKFFGDAEKAALQQKLGIEEGDLILFAADQCSMLRKSSARSALCRRRAQGHGRLVVDANRFDFLGW